MHSLVYALGIQASLDNILVGMHSNLRKVIRVFDMHIQEAIDGRIGTLQPVKDGNESMETISNPGLPLRASTPVAEDEDDGVCLKDHCLSRGHGK